MKGVAVFKRMLKKIFWAFPVLNKCKFFVEFVLKNKYWPDFKNPKTFNEKINFRKNNAKNELFSICSDKIAAKDWVAEKIGEEYIIPNYFVGDSIDFICMKNIIQEKGDCLLKANHNSGPVFLLTKDSTDEEIKKACEDINMQLKVDFGKIQNEPWYSSIKPKVLVEKRLKYKNKKGDINDYKFHVFKNNSGELNVILHIDFDRSSNHNRSYFNENLEWLPFSVLIPSIKTSVEKPENFEKMLFLARKLAEPFSYVRVDFYNIDGEIYFGELTFAPGSGCSPFSFYGYDLWMGNLWHEDPSF